MARKPDHLADFEADDAGGVLSGLLAEENELDRRTLWRIGSWGAGATGAVIPVSYTHLTLPTIYSV